MAAAAALNVVKQIASLADGPGKLELKDCMSQVVSSLQFFLDHPDSIVRVSAARTLLKLKQGFPVEMKGQDLGRVRAALTRYDEAVAAGDPAPDLEELRPMLLQLMDDDAAAAAAAPPGSEADAAIAATLETGTEPASQRPQRGEVVVEVAEEPDAALKAALLEKVVALPGVMSVTFEANLLLVNTQYASLAQDTSFQADLVDVVNAQGGREAKILDRSSPCAGGGRGDQPASGAEAAGAGHDEDELGPLPDADEAGGEPAYLEEDEEEREQGGSARWEGASRQAAPAGGGADAAGFPAGAPCGGAPGFGAGGGYPALGGRFATAQGGYPGAQGLGPPEQWSFFSQSHWTIGRHIAERDDDPTIASRLARAKKREQERKQEEKSRVGRLFSALTGRR
eukprot:TRINITY_DN41296_c0_g1_i1.p1 TRINITY_DN41296_c0_g1~~TRINITY_DN41296_c0_g1_i1.p1  ORF type:complete len:424 (-),score=112.99 TRINITY_DN41296_c0_g1_i1:132-1322(-)